MPLGDQIQSFTGEEGLEGMTDSILPLPCLLITSSDRKQEAGQSWESAEAARFTHLMFLMEG